MVCVHCRTMPATLEHHCTAEIEGVGQCRLAREHDTGVIAPERIRQCCGQSNQGSRNLVGMPATGNLFQCIQAVSLGHCVVHNCGHS